MHIGRRSARLPAIVAVALTLVPAASFAFGVDEDGHLGITSTVLRGYSRTLGGRTYRFSPKAIQEIRKANGDVDWNQIDAGLHFDDEAFGAGTARLTNLRQQVVALVANSPRRGPEARRVLGQALHTLQDFYAHSNWVELGNGGIDTRLGRSTYGAAGPAVATCPTNPWTLGGAGLTTLTSGYFPLTGICGGGTPAGKCRHGFPFLCPEGINKDKPGRPGYPQARELAEAATRDFLEQVILDPALVDNAPGVRALLDVVPTLGVVVDVTGSMGPHIDDVKSAIHDIVPRLILEEHPPSQYLLQWFNDPDVGTPDTTDDPAAFLAGVDALTTYGGYDCPEMSMTGMRAAVEACDEGGTLLLFTDADARDSDLEPEVTAAAMAKEIRVVPVLFGACAEESGSPPPGPGEERVATPPGTARGVPGDAIPRGFAGSGQQSTGAHARSGVLGVTGSPSRWFYDDAYLSMARTLGTTAYRLDPASPGLEVTKIVAAEILGRASTVMDLRGRVVADTTLGFDLESGATRLRVAVQFPRRADVHLLRPDGAPVSPDTLAPATGASDQLVFFELAAPPAGHWTLALLGGGEYAVNVRAVSDVEPLAFDWVVPGGRPGHEGLGADTTTIATGDSLLGRVTMSGPVASLTFAAVDAEGAVRAAITPIPGDPSLASNEWLFSMVAPARGFRIAAHGVDSTGAAFERVVSPSYREQRLDVRILDPGFPWAVGRGIANTFQCVVRNQGDAATIRASGACLEGFPTTLSDSLFALGAGASDTLVLTVFVPANTPYGTYVNLAVSAERGGAPESRKTGRFVTGVYDLPPTCQLVQPTISWIWPEDRRWVGVGFRDLRDPEGGPITWRVRGVWTWDPIGGTSDTTRCPEARIVQDTVVFLRADRLDGTRPRVYEVVIEASDYHDLCQASRYVCVGPDPAAACGPPPDIFGDSATLPCGLLSSELDPLQLEASVVSRGPRRFRLSWALPAPARAGIRVYDVAGRRVAEPLAPSLRADLRGEVAWDASRLASGIYFVRFDLGGVRRSKTLVVR